MWFYLLNWLRLTKLSPDYLPVQCNIVFCYFFNRYIIIVLFKIDLIKIILAKTFQINDSD